MKLTALLITLLLAGSTAANLFYFKLHLSSTPKSDKLGSIVRLVRDGRTFCTGVVVSPTTILTALHCVATESPFGPLGISQEPIEIRTDANQPLGVTAKPYSGRIQLDQAILVGDFKQFGPRPFMSSITDLNKQAQNSVNLIACGYPLGGDLYCSHMYFNNLYDFMWSVQGLLLPGMSGGPVMLEDGTVVALNIEVEGKQSIVSPIYNIQTQFKGKK